MNTLLENSVPSSKKSSSLLKRLVREHVLPYKGRFVLALFFMILSAVSNGAIPFVLQNVIDDIFVQKQQHLLFIVSFSVFAAFTLRGIGAFGETVFMTSIGQRIICDLQNRLFKHLMEADLSFYHRYQSGELISRFTNDITLMRYAVSNVIVGLGKDAVTLIVLVLLMFYRDWTLATAAFILVPTVVLPISKVSRRMRKVTYNTQDAFGRMAGQLSQLFLGMRVVKSYGMEPYEITRIRKITETVYQLIVKAARTRALNQPIIESLGGLSSMIIIGYGGWQVIQGNRTPGEFTSFAAAMLLCYEPLKRLGALNASLQEGLGAAQRVFELLDIPSHIKEPTHPQKLTHVKGEIVFDNVTFCYGDQEEALKKVSFTVRPGETVALVGASGSGKSTIINLIPRFYDVMEGDIRIDGISIKELSITELRSYIGLVSQEITLFDDTVYNNIAYGNLKASPEDVYSAAEGAAAHEFINDLPNGYETMIGENGVVLSGGQRQRIAIARAMLKNAPILLLDEATSALDTHSERQVQESLDKLMKDRTTLVIAHRLSTVVKAHCIHVLQNGKIIESGTHETLIEKKGAYEALWLAQSTANHE